MYRQQAVEENHNGTAVKWDEEVWVLMVCRSRVFKDMFSFPQSISLCLGPSDALGNYFLGSVEHVEELLWVLHPISDPGEFAVINRGREYGPD